MVAVAEPYTLTQADLDGCRKILAQLEGHEAKTGGYAIGPIQGNQGSATATVRFERSADPLAAAAAIDCYLASPVTLTLVCQKLIAHFETHPEEVDRG